jgi:hypothetical protein
MMSDSIRSGGAREYGQNLIMQQIQSSHQQDLARASTERDPLLQAERGGLDRNHDDESVDSLLNENGNSSVYNSIRFQVLVWSVGALDVVQGRVPVTFRLTMFWNDMTSLRQTGVPEDDDLGGEDESNATSSLRPRSWEMRGRQKAVPRATKNDMGHAIEVPPVSILNVVTFDTIGGPEISLLRPDTGLWRWTCMYRTTLIQEHWRLDNFPHDSHDIVLRLAILAHRKAGAQWDRRVWQLGLATENDSQGCTRVPYGLVVEQVSVPEFRHDHHLQFELEPLFHGPGGTRMTEQCLCVKLRVQRNSYYYDRNIVPLLGMLNLVAITITGLGADEFFQRGLLTLNIAFVEISIRMATDKHLPSVPYQIKLQRVLNEYFFGLLFLVIESNLVYELYRYGYTSITGAIDAIAACAVFTHNAWTLYDYYVVSRRPSQLAEHKSEVDGRVS